MPPHGVHLRNYACEILQPSNFLNGKSLVLLTQAFQLRAVAFKYSDGWIMNRILARARPTIRFRSFQLSSRTRRIIRRKVNPAPMFPMNKANSYFRRIFSISYRPTGHPSSNVKLTSRALAMLPIHAGKIWTAKDTRRSTAVTVAAFVFYSTRSRITSGELGSRGGVAPLRRRAFRARIPHERIAPPVLFGCSILVGMATRVNANLKVVTRASAGHDEAANSRAPRSPVKLCSEIRSAVKNEGSRRQGAWWSDFSKLNTFEYGIQSARG